MRVSYLENRYSIKTNNNNIWTESLTIQHTELSFVYETGKNILLKSIRVPTSLAIQTGEYEIIRKGKLACRQRVNGISRCSGTKGKLKAADVDL